MGPARRSALRRLIGRRIAPPRFLAVLVLMPLGTWGYRQAVPQASWSTALAMGFDLAALIFLGSLLPLIRDRGAEAIRSRADANDANRVMVLLVTTLLTLVVLAAIAGELAAARKGELLPTAQLVGTLLLAWTFANGVFSLHYAHEYYTRHPESGSDCGGLDFPGEASPGYVDFAYFAFTLGMTFQTSDVAITRSRLRGVATLHAFAAFTFNIGVIAFIINVLGGAAG